MECIFIYLNYSQFSISLFVLNLILTIINSLSYEGLFLFPLISISIFMAILLYHSNIFIEASHKPQISIQMEESGEPSNFFHFSGVQNLH